MVCDLGPQNITYNKVTKWPASNSSFPYSEYIYELTTYETEQFCSQYHSTRFWSRYHSTCLWSWFHSPTTWRKATSRSWAKPRLTISNPFLISISFNPFLISISFNLFLIAISFTNDLDKGYVKKLSKAKADNLQPIFDLNIVQPVFDLNIIQPSGYFSAILSSIILLLFWILRRRFECPRASLLQSKRLVWYIWAHLGLAWHHWGSFAAGRLPLRQRRTVIYILFENFPALNPASLPTFHVHSEFLI